MFNKYCAAQRYRANNIFYRSKRVILRHRSTTAIVKHAQLWNEVLVFQLPPGLLHQTSRIITLLKHFIIQQLHKYIIRRYNYNYYKIFKTAPTCFGSQGIHHRGTLYSAWLKLQ
jgi:hypothetical protein